ALLHLPRDGEDGLLHHIESFLAREAGLVCDTENEAPVGTVELVPNLVIFPVVEFLNQALARLLAQGTLFLLLAAQRRGRRLSGRRAAPHRQFVDTRGGNARFRQTETRGMALFGEWPLLRCDVSWRKTPSHHARR